MLVECLCFSDGCFLSFPAIRNFCSMDSGNCRFPSSASVIVRLQCRRYHGWVVLEMNGRVLFTPSGLVGLVRLLAQSAPTTSGMAGYLCSFLSSGVVIYGSNSKITQDKALVELDPPSVQLMRVDYPIKRF